MPFLLAASAGPFFLQLPPGYRADKIDDLEHWLAAWPEGRQLAVEVRHDDWYAEPGESALMALLDRYGAGRVVMDVRPLNAGPLPGAELDLQQARDRKPDVPMHPLRSGGLALIRYIGHPTPELNEPLLDEWSVGPTCRRCRGMRWTRGWSRPVCFEPDARTVVSTHSTTGSRASTTYIA